MGYLICEKCGGYYKLQPEESINDFEGCSCGGKFTYVENLEGYDNTIKEDKVNTTNNITRKSSDDQKCPNCGADKNKGAVFCKVCGFNFDSSSKSAKSAEIKENSYKICPKCNENNPDDAVFCRECGSNLKEEPKNVGKKVSRNNLLSGVSGRWNKKGSGAKAAIIIAGICCVGLLILFTGMTSLQNFKSSGVSFQYPQDWKQDNSTILSPAQVVILNSNKGGGSRFMVIKTDAEGKGLEYWINQKSQSESNSNITIISKGTMQIAGVTGYQVVSSYNMYGNSGQILAINLVKNGKYYQLSFRTESISAIQSDIDTIVNSFQTY